MRKSESFALKDMVQLARMDWLISQSIGEMVLELSRWARLDGMMREIGRWTMEDGGTDDEGLTYRR